jgi:hypothetical protein
VIPPSTLPAFDAEKFDPPPAPRALEGSEPAPRRVDVFIDYWYAYRTARDTFAGSPIPPPAWFGNVSPSALAATVAKERTIADRRSQRVLGRTHVFLRRFDPDRETHNLERIARWQNEGEVNVVLVPRPEETHGHPLGTITVALACSVVQALERRACEIAVVFAGDGALWPLFTLMRGGEVPSRAIELATWVRPDGQVPTSLIGLADIWCHRLGPRTFNALTTPPLKKPASAAPHRSSRRPAQRPAPPQTALGAAFTAAGVDLATMQALGDVAVARSQAVVTEGHPPTEPAPASGPDMEGAHLVEPQPTGRAHMRGALCQLLRWPRRTPRP